MSTPNRIAAASLILAGAMAVAPVVASAGTTFTLAADTVLSDVTTGTPVNVSLATMGARRVSDGVAVTPVGGGPSRFFLENGKLDPVEVNADSSGVEIDIVTGAQVYRRVLLPNAEGEMVLDVPQIFLSRRALTGRLTSGTGIPAANAPLELLHVYPGRTRPQAFFGDSPANSGRTTTGPGGIFYIPLLADYGGEEIRLRVFPQGSDVWYSAEKSFIAPTGFQPLLLWNGIIGLKDGGQSCNEPTPSGGAVAFPQVQSIFTTACIVCHGGGNPAANLDLSEGFALGQLANRLSSSGAEGLLLLNVANRSESFLSEVLNCSEPQVPLNVSHAGVLTQSQRQTITNWIAGTPLDARALSVTIGASQTTGISPQGIEFRAGIIGGQPPYTAEWDFVDGTRAEGIVASHTFYTSAGTRTFPVSLTVRDAVGASATVTQNVIIALPDDPMTSTPVATFSIISANPKTPFPVELDASDSFSNTGVIVRYDWDFDNDGVFDFSSSKPTVRYQFQTVGTRAIRLRVIDSNNNAGSVTLNVKPRYEAFSSFAFY